MTLLRAPSDGLGAERAGNPHLWIRLLIRQRPWVYVAIVEMFALVAPRTGPGPRLNDEVVRLFEIFAVVSGIGVVEELLAARAAHPSGDQTSARNEIDLGQLFRHPQWMFDDWQRIAD